MSLVPENVMGIISNNIIFVAVDAVRSTSGASQREWLASH